jgi:hypothetical protein
MGRLMLVSVCQMHDAIHSSIVHVLNLYVVLLVALSRATELKLLTLRGFSEKAFRAHPLVKVINHSSMYAQDTTRSITEPLSL